MDDNTKKNVGTQLSFQGSSPGIPPQKKGRKRNSQLREGFRKLASHLDAATEAKKILDSEMIEGIYGLRFWKGSFYRWKDGRFVEMETSEARSIIIKRLNPSFSQLCSRVVNDVIDQVKAQSILPGTVQPPLWLNETPEDPPADELLSARNGLIHLPSLVTNKDFYFAPTPRFFTTVALDYDFCVEAKSPDAWLGFLNQLWPNDPDSISALQEWFGYCLTPDTSMQKILLMIGPKRSGKGTIARIIRQLIGEANVAGPTLANLATNFGLATLLGKSLAIVADARLSGRVDQSQITERLLAISGEDALTIDRKYREQITTKLLARFMIFSNELPRLSDPSGALSSRMIVLRMTESFFGREDRTLTDRLQSELPGILLWAIEGWRRLRERGYFAQPESGKELHEDLDDLSSPVGMFVKDCCCVGVEFTVAIEDLFHEWCEWCARKGRREHGTEQTFGRDLRAVLPSLRTVQPSDRGRRYRAYEGIRIDR